MAEDMPAKCSCWVVVAGSVYMRVCPCESDHLRRHGHFIFPSPLDNGSVAPSRSSL